MSEDLSGLSLADAQRAREKRLDDAFIEQLDEMLETTVPNYKLVTPRAKLKLKGILAKYAKSPKPFTECVRDNRKRFGPRAEQVCAVVKDLIRNTTKWRGKGKEGMSEKEMTQVRELFETLSEDDIITLAEGLV